MGCIIITTVWPRDGYTFGTSVAMGGGPADCDADLVVSIIMGKAREIVAQGYTEGIGLRD
jgi:hypothetical protein